MAAFQQRADIPKATTTCVHCGATYRTKSDSVGKTVRCRQCQKKFSIPDQISGNSEDTASRVAVEATIDEAIGNQEPSEVGVGSVTQFGRFVIDSEWEPKSGSFGTIYKAIDPILDRVVALKVPHHGLLKTDAEKEQFLQEPRTAGRLMHPNIVPVFDAQIEGEQVFIASAFIDGQTLDEMVKQRPDFDAAVAMIQKLARTSVCAYKRGCAPRRQTWKYSG